MLTEKVVSRSKNIAAQLINPFLLDTGESWREKLKYIKVSTLIIHGTKDPLFPYDHAEALKNEITNASIMPLQGVGHGYIPKEMWENVLLKIIEHTSILA